jgi:hypothetical protein
MFVLYGIALTQQELVAVNRKANDLALTTWYESYKLRKDKQKKTVLEFVYNYRIRVADLGPYLRS